MSSVEKARIKKKKLVTSEPSDLVVSPSFMDRAGQNGKRDKVPGKVLVDGKADDGWQKERRRRARRERGRWEK